MFSRALCSEEPTTTSRPERPPNPDGKACLTKARPSFAEIQTTFRAMQREKRSLARERVAMEEFRRLIRDEVIQHKTSSTAVRRDFQASLELARTDCLEQFRKLADEAKTLAAARTRFD